MISCNFDLRLSSAVLGQIQVMLMLLVNLLEVQTVLEA